jgi:hypothetical protein
MDDFRKYTAMKAAALSPRDAYVAGQADGLDEITLIRMLRSVYGLSLADAKQVTDAVADLTTEQTIKDGDAVYWEGWDTVDGFYILQARVASLEGDEACLRDHRKFLVRDDGLHEVPVGTGEFSRLRVSHLKRSLPARLEELLNFVEQLPTINASEKDANGASTTGAKTRERRKI